MVEIHGSKDCGNSPKNKFTQDMAILLERGETDMKGLSDDVVWHGIMDKPIEGKEAVEKQLSTFAKPVAIVVEHAISHGRVGTASGEIILSNGHKKRFCHVFDFTNAKANCVAAIQSYN